MNLTYVGTIFVYYVNGYIGYDILCLCYHKRTQQPEKPKAPDTESNIPVSEQWSDTNSQEDSFEAVNILKAKGGVIVQIKSPYQSGNSDRGKQPDNMSNYGYAGSITCLLPSVKKGKGQ